MAIYDVKLTHRKQVADGTTQFFFTKPADLKYRAGQFFDVILDKSSPDAQKSTWAHGFSFVSAPYEDYVSAATRMRNSPFKNAIAKVPDGAPVKLEAVWGEFVLPHKPQAPVVYLTGGIGVTPVRSMIAQATHDGSAQDLTLIYANRTPGFAAFVPELRGFAKANPHFKFVETYTQQPSTDASAEHGHVDEAMIRRHVKDVDNSVYYLSGPAGMVRAMRELLVKMRVDDDNIRTEEFEGY